MQKKQRVAIIGSGCSGIGAFWALKSTAHEVHLYEAQERLGGHTNTVKFQHNGQKTNVDTGFIVLNSATYPNFIAFLKEIGIETAPTEMTFGVSRDAGRFEWAGTSLSSIFAQRMNLFRPSMWRMLFDIVRFNQFALDLLAIEDESEEDPVTADNSRGSASHSSTPLPDEDQQTIGEYLVENGYSDAFRDHYLIPMTASVWSTSPDKASLDFPALTLVRFLWNHHLLTTLGARPTWMTIPDGSRQYIDAVLKDVPQSRIHTGVAIKCVTNDAHGKVRIIQQDGREVIFDHVIIATHGDTARDLVAPGASSQEVDILSGFSTSRNVAVLHSDRSLMPKRRLAWSAWNYICESKSMSSCDATDSATSSGPAVCLTYWMNLLQQIPPSRFGDVFVTLNPLHRPAEATIQGEWTYNHPLYNARAIRSQKLLSSIQNVRGISYAGAWTKYGFHEDGFSSGVKVAIDHLGAALPFEFIDSTFSRGRCPPIDWKDECLRFTLSAMHLFFCLLASAYRIIYAAIFLPLSADFDNWGSRRKLHPS